MPTSKLSNGAIAGIAVAASAAFLAIIAFVVFCARRRRRANRRKQSLIVNPRLNTFHRFSFIARSIRSRSSNRSVHSPPGEKEPHFGSKAPEDSEGGVLDIRAHKEGDDEVEDIEAARGIHEIRHASQNSDGSYSIDLPELPARGHTHARIPSGQQPIPTSTVSPPAKTARFSVRPSKPMGPRSMNPSSPTMHQRETSRGILLAEMYRAAMGDDYDDPNSGLNTAGIQTGGLGNRESRQADEASPLRVNFEDETYEAALQRHEGRYASAGVISLPQSLKLALSLEPSSLQSSPPIRPNVTVTHSTPVTPITPITPITPVTQQDEPRHDHHLSFLDLESSGSASLKSGARSTIQSRSNSTRSSSKSRYDPSMTTDYGSLLPDRRISLGLSMAMAGPSSSRPSLSPNISLQPVSLPAQSSPHEPASVIPEDAAQPIDPDSNGHMMDFLPSPTESIPHTVSDIHFRHSSYSSIGPDSRRASANRFSGLQRHPPLPGTPASPPPEPKPFIVQRLLGMASGGGPATPYSSPTTPAQSSAWPPSSGRGSVQRSHPYSLAPPSFHTRPK